MDVDRPTPGVPVAAGLPAPDQAPDQESQAYVTYMDNLYDISAAQQQRNYQLSLQRARTEPSLSPKKKGPEKADGDGKGPESAIGSEKEKNARGGSLL